MNKPKLCTIADCEHKHDPSWTHVAPAREIPVTAHLRGAA